VGADTCGACGCSLSVTVGATIGTWTIVAPLAVGGMSTVFRAEHARLKRPVCVKVITGAFGRDPQLLTRFEREAQVLASVSHPNVVSVLDFGSLPGGGLYLVCEFVEGRNLKTLIQQGGAVPATRAISLIRQVLKGLEAVHQQNVVHRDIKPANILVKQLPDGSELAQLADFGIARIVPPMQVTEAGLTQQGVMVGTPGYMAPEQILGEAVDARSDVYAVGVVLHEMLTGTKVFTSTNGVDVLMKHVSVEPAAPLSSPEDAWLNAVVLKALSKSPESRFPTAAAFAEALTPVAVPVPLPARPAPPRVPPPVLNRPGGTPNPVIGPVLPLEVLRPASVLRVESAKVAEVPRPSVSRTELPVVEGGKAPEPPRPPSVSRSELPRITVASVESSPARSELARITAASVEAQKPASAFEGSAPLRSEPPRITAASVESQKPSRVSSPSWSETPRITASAEKPAFESSPSRSELPRVTGEPQKALSERGRTLVALMQQWSTSIETSRAEAARSIEAKLAEWFGQGVLEPLVEVLPLLRARREPGLESVIRALVVERIGAVVRASTDAKSLQALLTFAGAEAHQRLIASLRSVENPALAGQLAGAVMQGPLREVTDQVGRMTAAAVGAVVKAASPLSLTEVRPLLVLCLNHAEANARLAAVDGLSASHALQLVVEVRKRLTDKDRAVRQRVALLLGAIEDRASVPTLAAMLTRAESASERGAFATALAEMGGPEAATAVRAAFLAEKDLTARCLMAEALGQLGDNESLDVLARECGRLLAPAELKAIGRRFQRR
jgi:serine/threonine protein kinase